MSEKKKNQFTTAINMFLEHSKFDDLQAYLSNYTNKNIAEIITLLCLNEIEYNAVIAKMIGAEIKKKKGIEIIKDFLKIENIGHILSAEKQSNISKETHEYLNMIMGHIGPWNQWLGPYQSKSMFEKWNKETREIRKIINIPEETITEPNLHKEIILNPWGAWIQHENAGKIKTKETLSAILENQLQNTFACTLVMPLHLQIIAAWITSNLLNSKKEKEIKEIISRKKLNDIKYIWNDTAFLNETEIRLIKSGWEKTGILHLLSDSDIETIEDKEITQFIKKHDMDLYFAIEIMKIGTIQFINGSQTFLHFIAEKQFEVPITQSTAETTANYIFQYEKNDTSWWKMIEERLNEPEEEIVDPNILFRNKIKYDLNTKFIMRKWISSRRGRKWFMDKFPETNIRNSEIKKIINSK